MIFVGKKEVLERNKVIGTIPKSDGCHLVGYIANEGNFVFVAGTSRDIQL